MRSAASRRLALLLVCQLLTVGLLSACQHPLLQIAIVSEASSALSGGQTLAAARATPHVRPTPTRTPTATPTPLPTPAPATEPPDRLVIPAIGLDVPVAEAGWIVDEKTGQTTWQTPQDAAGFLHGSAFPGQPGNTVISGHHNLGARVFAKLHTLQVGAVIHLYAGGECYNYIVVDAFILPERGVPDEQRLQNARWIGPTADERLTLITCWPENDNSHRVIVVARPAHGGAS